MDIDHTPDTTSRKRPVDLNESPLPPLTKRKTSSMESIELALDDATLDRELLQKLQKDEMSAPLRRVEQKAIITYIVKQLPNHLNQRYSANENADDLLSELGDELVALLKSAFLNQQFRKIRRLKVLQIVKSPLTKRKKSSMESVVLALDDVTLDRELLQKLQKDEMSAPLRRVEQKAIITYIVKQLPNHLNQRYSSIEDAGHLLSELGDELVTLLQSAFLDQQFHKIRRLKVLQIVRSPRSSMPSNSYTPEAQMTRTAMKSAWSRLYNGKSHELLLANINRLQKGKPYSNQIAIVQSSGTGKSRMVHEQASLVFTIPFNLRKKEDDEYFPYPAPDDDVRDHLVDNGYPIHTNEAMLKTNYLKFLGSVFTQVRKELAVHESELAAGPRPVESAQELAQWWTHHLTCEGSSDDGASIRMTLYKDAIEDAKKNIEIHPEHRKEYEAELEAWRKKANNYKSTSDPTVEEFAAAKSANEALTELIEKLGQYRGSGSTKLVMYFDEAHPLTEHNASLGDDEKSPYDVLCYCLCHFLTQPMTVLFLSTNSSLAKFAAPQALAKSARIRGGLAKTHAPITETPFDCHPKLLVGAGTLKIEDVSAIPFMAQFGRPLFWTLLRGAGEHAGRMHEWIIELARAKLLASSELDDPYTSYPAVARMAVLDVQLSLDYEPRREKVQNQEATLVESHMRLAYSIPDDRAYLRSGYPSEPILAEAAARQLRTWRLQNPSVVIEALVENVTGGLLDRGELGELAGRELLLSAYQRAVESEQLNRPKDKPVHFSAGCHLVTFIEMLFTDEYANEILDSFPDNVESGVKFRDAFKGGMVRFTHFGRMGDDTGTTSNAMWPAFIRGMAIICRKGQFAVDCIIPVLLWDAKICEHVMTGVLVQFKRRAVKGTIAAYSIDERKLPFFASDDQECTHGSKESTHPVKPAERPYLSLIMELGIQKPVSQEAKTGTIFKKGGKKKIKITKSKGKNDKRPRTPPKTHTEAPVQSTPSKVVVLKPSGKRHHPSTEHPRYNVFAYGCSSTVYCGINAKDNVSYALLLGTRDFLGEHARQDPKTLAAIRRMKAIWVGGEDCYHWILLDNMLKGPYDYGSEKDWVLVGDQALELEVEE